MSQFTPRFSAELPPPCRGSYRHGRLISRARNRLERHFGPRINSHVAPPDRSSPHISVLGRVVPHALFWARLRAEIDSEGFALCLLLRLQGLDQSIFSVPLLTRLRGGLLQKVLLRVPRWFVLGLIRHLEAAHSYGGGGHYGRFNADGPRCTLSNAGREISWNAFFLLLLKELLL